MLALSEPHEFNMSETTGGWQMTGDTVLAMGNHKAPLR